MIKTPLEGALYLIEKYGFYVFPLARNSKMPIRNSSWKELSTNDPNRAKVYAKKFPSCNFAVDCEKSNLTVIDIDRKEKANGFESIKPLLKEHGKLPLTLAVETPSKGRHIFYKDITKTTQSDLGKGIDTRSKGGYVVAVGSIIGEKTYAIHKGVSELATTPNWVKKLIAQPKHDDKPKTEGEIIVEGERNGKLLSLAGLARSQGCSASEIEALLIATNEERVSPPLPLSQIKTLVKSVLKYPVEHARTLSELEAEVIEKDVPFLFSGADVVASSHLRIPWVAEGRYAKGYLTVCVAKGGVGKTLFMFSDLLGISVGKDFLNYGTKIEKTNTWLHSTEDSKVDLERRLLATRHAHGVSAEEASGFFLSSGRDIPFNVAFMERGKVIKNLVDIKLIKKTIKENSIGLFAIDPFSGAHGLDENSNAHMVFVKNILNEIAEETGCAVCIVHHARKSSSNGVEASRGASALTDGARTVLMFSELTEDDGKKFGLEHPDKYTKVAFVKSNNASREKCPVIYFEKKSLEIDQIGEAAAAVPFSPEVHSLIEDEPEEKPPEKEPETDDLGIDEPEKEDIEKTVEITDYDIESAINNTMGLVRERVTWKKFLSTIRGYLGLDPGDISDISLKVATRKLIAHGNGVLDTGSVCVKQSSVKPGSVSVFPSKGVEPIWDG